MTNLSALLRRTAFRYLRAKELVEANYPDSTGEEYEHLVAEQVLRLAEEEKTQ